MASWPALTHADRRSINRYDIKFRLNLVILDGVVFFFSFYFARVDLKDLLPFVISRLAFISLAALMIVALSPAQLPPRPTAVTQSAQL